MSNPPLHAARQLAANLQSAADSVLRPPSAIAASHAEPVVYMALVRGTRGYIERVAHQVNGSYAHGWYDACSVMLRRLIETLLIECFEAHRIEHQIKDTSGNYVFLRDLVDRALAERSWSLGRSVRSSLPRLKEIGDKSAHSRRYNAHREDIDKLAKDVRDVVQELVSLAKLK